MYLDEILKRYQEEVEITSSVLLLFLAAIVSLWSFLFHVVFSLKNLASLQLRGFCTLLS